MKIRLQNTPTKKQRTNLKENKIPRVWKKCWAWLKERESVQILWKDVWRKNNVVNGCGKGLNCSALSLCPLDVQLASTVLISRESRLPWIWAWLVIFLGQQKGLWFIINIFLLCQVQYVAIRQMFDFSFVLFCFNYLFTK